MVKSTNRDSGNKRSPLWAAYGALVLPAVFLFLLGILHIIEPEIQPWWRLISEYQLGQYGWLMHAAFIILVVGALCALVALRPHIRSRAGKVGLFLLFVAAFGMTLGALFVTDPITTPRSDFSQSGLVHNIGGALMIFSSPVLIGLVSWSLVRHNPEWRYAKLALLWLSLLSIASVVAFGVLSVVQYRGAASPEMIIGWPNRTLIAAYCLWLIVVGWYARKLALNARTS